jgi:hypothetical protein
MKQVLPCILSRAVLTPNQPRHSVQAKAPDTILHVGTGLTFHTQSLLNLLPLEEREEMKSAPNNRNNRLNCPLYPVRIA